MKTDSGKIKARKKGSGGARPGSGRKKLKVKNAIQQKPVYLPVAVIKAMEEIGIETQYRYLVYAAITDLLKREIPEKLKENLRKLKLEYKEF
jgi:hypothetical protein